MDTSARVPVDNSGFEQNILAENISQKLKYNADGLIAAIVQDHLSEQVLMLAWMNDEALALTLNTRQGTYFSRSRRKIWVKGETSGHRQKVVSVQLDCDGDAVLLRVIQTGPACHRGTTTCFEDGEL